MKLIYFTNALNIELHVYSRVFHKLDEIGNNVNINDPPSSTHEISSERRVLDLESEAEQRSGFNPHWRYHFVAGFFFFHVVKPLMPVLALLALCCVFVKNSSVLFYRKLSLCPYAFCLHLWQLNTQHITNK